jgi:serine/threonine protein kinase
MSRSGTIQAPPGFRDSPLRAVNPGDVVASAYAIRCEVARTDTGVVYEARDLLIERPVALKLAWRDPGTPSLVLEARRCAQVRDPCAVAIHGVGDHHGVEYVVAERVTGVLLRELLRRPLPAEAYLARLRVLAAAVARAHEHGVAVGDLSGGAILVDRGGRMVLGPLSMSQVPAPRPGGQPLAPEVARGEVEASDPRAALSIDLYGLGCLAIEMARGAPPLPGADPGEAPGDTAPGEPPRLSDLRPDLPGELSDLIEWLLADAPAGRPASAGDVLAQLDALVERLGATARSIRVLVVDDDTARGRLLWSLARRAHPSAIVEISSEGADAAHKLHRDKPDLVFVDASLRGVMNALELCMYARGIESEHAPELVLIGDLSERDRALFAGASVASIPGGVALPNEVIERVRQVAAEPRRRRKPRTISG